MKRIFLLLLCAVSIASITNAQDRRSTFRVDAPAVLMGEKIIDESNTAGTTPWGSGIDSAWEGMDVKFDPTNLNGCQAGGFPANFFDGKFALIYRGDCEFGSKAYAAQLAGAEGVIIVNNLLGVVGMAAGTQGGLVTIPVVMITKEAGDNMVNQINSSNPVTVSLTGWRFDATVNPIDVGIKHNGPIYPQGRAIPFKQLETTVNFDENFRLYGGGRWYNFSNLSFDTVRAKSVFTSPSSADSNQINYFNPTSWLTTDSIFVTITDSLGTNLAGYDLNDAAVGSYSMKNEITALPTTYSETGLNANNNSWEYTFEVTDSVYSKCEYDVQGGKPVVNSYIALNANTYEWGPLLYIRNGGHSAKKMQCVIMRDIIQDSVFTGQQVFMTIHEWSDVNVNGALDARTELTEVGSATYTMTASDIVPIEGMVLTLDVVNSNAPGAPVRLKRDTYYWVTVEFNGVAANSFGIGLDYYSNYSGSLLGDDNLSSIQGNPLYNSDDNAFFGGGFAGEGAPAIALHMTRDVDPTAVNDIGQINGEIKIFPNPANTQINIDVALTEMTKEVQYEILDVTGRTISTVSRDNIQNEVYTMSTSGLSAGAYFMKVTTNEGVKTMKFTVVK
jgi:hypothetical protein